MVEPPRILGARPVADGRAASCASMRALRSQAFSMASQSTPSWLTKLSSSDATTARLRWSDICAYGTHCWRQRTPLPWDHCAQASDRWKVVDSGSITAMAAMRATKNSCSASSASSTSMHQRSAPRMPQAPAAMAARSSCSTGADGGRTPRQSRNASAACSTSMPSPSRAVAPWAVAQSRKGCAAGPYIMS